MIKPKQLIFVIVSVLIVPITAAAIFYHIVVGRSGLTNFWSVFFGCQLLIILIAVLGAVVYARGRIRHYLAPLFVVVGTLLIVIVPSWVSTSSGRYITGDGGPAGPDFNCLLWSKDGLFSTYDLTWGFGCGVMSIPSYSKFWIDQRYAADESDNSASYYVAFAFDETVLLSGVIGSLLLVQRNSRRSLI